MKNIIFLMALFCSFNLFSQVYKHKYERERENEIEIINNLKIQHIKGLPPRETKIIKEFIEETKVKNKYFRDGFGYISIRNIKNYNGAPILVDKDFKGLPPSKYISFGIFLDTSPMHTDEKIINSGSCLMCDVYPLFYTKIDGKLILIYSESMDEFLNYYPVFSKRSRKKLVRKVNKTLELTLNPNFEFSSFLSPEKGNYLLDKDRRKKMSKFEILNYGNTMNFKNYWQVDLLSGNKNLIIKSEN